MVPDKSFKKGQAQQHFIEQELVTQGDEENAPPGGNNGWLILAAAFLFSTSLKCNYGVTGDFTVRYDGNISLGRF